MALSTTATINLAKSMDLESCVFPQGKFSKATGRTALSTERAYSDGQTVDNTREIFKTINSTARVNTHGQMASISKASTRWIRKMDTVS